MFLRDRRAKVRPEDAGLPEGTRRRTPGLRRAEVAHLAGISVDYYIRLEQARGPRPSRQVLGALARALRLADDERTYLYHLADERPDLPAGPPQEVPQGVLRMLDRLDGTPAYVMDAKYDVLAWNDLAAALIRDFAAQSPRDRNIIRRICRDGGHDERFVRDCLADLRATAAKYPSDPGVRELVAEVNAVPGLAAMWDEREVRVRRSSRKRIDHPLVGTVELDVDYLVVPECDQRVVLYTAAPDTPSHEALRRLRTVGARR
ncbi:helix-turn-helix transcriptional regulator [Actinomadura logoneensis]|uniref:helix-turn-helix transcriptional regulator n=1 Tax=Actinomadura logoneensis TaxID=2293572 RepID=UPI001F2AD637|nr:helix-turn-helix transcriptional regulator [Actinomadura logoneensis]